MSLSKVKSFDIIMVTPNDRCIKAIEYIIRNSCLDHSFFLIDNGATALGYDLGEYSKLVKLSVDHDTLKIPEIYNMAWKLTTTEFVAFIHNDTIILENAWDLKMEKYLTDAVGVAGVCGATGYGNEKIYKRPFELADVARIDFRWNFDNQEVREYADSCSRGYDDRWLRSHGKSLSDELTRAAVVDGLAMVVNRNVLEKTGGFDEDFVFQGFDEDMCLHALDLGYKNYMVNVKYFHEGNGGATSYLNLLKAHNITDELVHGGSDGVHTVACRLLYGKWRRLLPIRKEDYEVI
jgi:hypothetical protein